MSTAVFDAYAAYYDLLYRDKDYHTEAAFVAAAVRRHAPNAQRLLEFGCGSGAHAVEFASLGFDVHGVDRSERMLEAAEARRATSGRGDRLTFSRGDIQSIRTGSTYDAVVSLFHVMNYQTTNTALRNAMSSARAHLAPGGIFLFDAWYGPGVLFDPPAVRVKRLRNAELEMTRLAEPTLYPNENVVEVNYRIFVRHLANGTVEELAEAHRMRYLFAPEVELLLDDAGFELVGAYEWLTERQPTTTSWLAYFIARAR